MFTPASRKPVIWRKLPVRLAKACVTVTTTTPALVPDLGPCQFLEAAAGDRLNTDQFCFLPGRRLELQQARLNATWAPKTPDAGSRHLNSIHAPLVACSPVFRPANICISPCRHPAMAILKIPIPSPTPARDVSSSQRRPRRNLVALCCESMTLPKSNSRGGIRYMPEPVPRRRPPSTLHFRDLETPCQDKHRSP